MNRVREELGDTVQIEKDASQEGRNITMVVAPVVGGKKPKKSAEPTQEG
jgi:translation initiation factor IF-3